MIYKPETTVTINIRRPEIIEIIIYEAQEARLGGRSNIFENHSKRMELIKENQLTGQIGNVGLHMLIFKEEYCIELYKKSREPFRINKYAGDNGMDIIDTHIDIKNSFMRGSRNVQHYNLIVRPKEFYSDWVYVSALTDVMNDKIMTVHIIGWAYSSDFPSEVDREGKLKGAYTIKHNRLRTFPLPDIFPEYLKKYIKEGVVEKKYENVAGRPKDHVSEAPL